MRKLLALLVICSAVLACDTRAGSSITVPFTAEIGTYSLKSIGGNPLPVQLATLQAGQLRFLFADTLFLTNGGNVQERLWIRTIKAPVLPATIPDTTVGSALVAGKYQITRDSLTLPAEFGYRFGRYSSGTISITDNQGFVRVFTKP